MASMSLRSSSVTLENIDDFLAPSQACVNPAFQPTNKRGGDDNVEHATENMVARTDSASSTNVVVPRRRRRIVRKRIISSNTPTELPETTTTGVGTSPISSSQQPIPRREEEDKKPKQAVKASMADCLACSGCVTTAETVMMEERHSLKSLRNRLSSAPSGGKDIPRIVTVSPNSWADICRHWKLEHQSESCGHDGAHGTTDNDCNHFYFSRFTTLLWKILSVKVVMDGNIPLQWTWIDEAQEFCQTYNKTLETSRVERHLQRANTIPTPLPSMAVDSSKTLYYKSDGTSEIRNNSERPTPNLPLVSGSCPALVCLVEKTLTNLVPHLSQSISPMSLVGVILNHDGQINNREKEASPSSGLVASGLDIDGFPSVNDEKNTTIIGNKWDHWAIMPCHDKKLEASRRDFANESKEQAVDLVISTHECVELVEEWIRSQQHQKNGQSLVHKESDVTFSVAKYLATLPPSSVSTDVLEPKDLLQKSSPCSIDGKSPPLLLTIPTICREDGNNKITMQNHHMAFSSGGHANFVFRYAAKKLFGYTFDDHHEHKHGTVKCVKWQAASLAAKNVRSARLGKLLKQHYYETKLYRHHDGSYGTTPVASENCEESSRLVLHFAVAHGMQTMQRALKQVVETTIGDTGNVSSTSTLHYLEAMACPHGCVNGGGSVRSSSTMGMSQKTLSSPNPTRETPTETRERVQSTLEHLKVPNLVINSTTKTPGPVESQNDAPLPRTEYHVVPPMNYTTGAVAGESVENMIW